MVSDFSLEQYITEKRREKKKQVPSERRERPTVRQLEEFQGLCETVYENMMEKFESEYNKELLERNNRAIIGYYEERSYFYDEIKAFLIKNQLEDAWYPEWYSNLIEAIFHENWGLAGITRWKNAMPTSQSAKIIGERIYYACPDTGVLQLQDQRISRNRLDQLMRALLLPTPELRMDEGAAEVYMLDGTRITILTEKIVKEPVIIFRKYIVDQLTFEEQVERGTIPREIVPMLKAKIKIGYNVCFIGPVKSGKTTFLSTWQSYEDKQLEGVQVETDPEIPQHLQNPEAPIIQFVADGRKLKRIIKYIKRCDGDYVIMGEARDAPASKIMLDITKIGTRRSKSNYHTSDPINFCHDVAIDLVEEFGGDVWATTINVARAYDYLYEFTQLKDKSQKRLKAIYEMRFDSMSMTISVHQILRYDFKENCWNYAYHLGEDKIKIAYEESVEESLKVFQNELQRLAEKAPIQGTTVFYPTANRLIKDKWGGGQNA